MNIAQGLQDSGAIRSMASEFGVDEATAQRAAGALLPAIVAGLGRDTVGAGGTRAGGGLGGILGSILGGGSGAASPAANPLDEVLNPQPTRTGTGNDILGQIFGNKDVSRGVAEEAAATTGLPAQLLKQMLPVLAMAVVGYMMKGRGGMLGGILGQVVASAVRRAV